MKATGRAWLSIASLLSFSAPSPAPADAADNLLEEIVVTAQKRSESLPLNIVSQRPTDSLRGEVRATAGRSLHVDRFRAQRGGCRAVRVGRTNAHHLADRTTRVWRRGAVPLRHLVAAMQSL